ncbi:MULTISPECIES: acyl-CoA dehydrogenase [Mycobacteriaceae]|uniref:Acyl-CoA dehydrogenase n=1 Tax=Mycolicibacterium neoaurum VKM Ac-1815D TaxID=700508 RepID=V5XB63_MYCNE|nr:MULTISPECIES: acyl-CoA dehydrogenase [Mycobacteriaceae]AHC25257.1 acyl-CoA dehydrogenase [Mycolicibacterium neoaurum VKM Ac-1815D]AMO05742.1 acyl-CoA dehydrogenase [Mycolicibacterium neoaurum]AXK75931.1 acyl-CoA dehydrogenase [Mycolicibacterium neoaurum]KJQ49409.1 acyl-CoA dehydrogenase [Mycolicibacterium neoaurum]KUM09046.1 acyl-CoA dehydrogenase [Mycolicibacterium neoaurum]
MALALTDEQVQLTEAMAGFARRHGGLELTRSQFDALAAGERPAFWAALVANGLHGVQLPEQGGGFVDAACVIDAAGYGLLPGPLLPTMIAGAVIADLPEQPAVRAAREALAAGGPMAVLLPSDGVLRAEPDGAGWRLTGAAGPQLGVAAAEHVIVAADTDAAQRLWFLINAAGPGVVVQAAAPTDLTRDVGTLSCADAPVAADAVLAGVDPVRARCHAIGLMAAEAAGIARWCVDNVVAYLKVREQFGRRIGAFQALQHKAAMLFIDSELAAAAAWDAVRGAEQPIEQHEIAAAGAAIAAIGKLPDLVVDALTMFGAIGYTWEHDLHLYWKRSISLAAAAGGVAEWAELLGEPDRQPRDFGIELAGVEERFRGQIAALIDAAAQLDNEAPGRQNPEYEDFWTGPRRTALADAGLVAPYLPAPWGLDATPAQQLVIDEEFDRRPTLTRPSLGIAQWILPTVIAEGTDGQRERFAVPTLRGEIGWCQLFSEPGAGSDLASLTTRATKVEGGWRIDGQKVWTSSAQRADWGALLARTDPQAAKHRGIGYFLIDMTSPGITIRPLRTASGDEHFNEVFFDDVFVPDDMLVGEPTAGWSHALATMANERVAIGAYAKLDKERELRALARQAGPAGVMVRHALGRVRAATNAIGALAVRDTLRRLAGHGPGPASSVGKVGTALLVRRVTADALAFSGRAAMVGGADHPAVADTLMMPAEVIGGGTVEIQLNIIATMILGLPRA